MSSKNIRIKDIAKAAGVSAGTVDRVLHKRGRVSEGALNKVMAVLRDADYKPNLIARMLGSYRNYQIAAIIPDPGSDDYWSKAKVGICQGENEWSQYGVHINFFTFDLSDKNSFEKASDKILKSNPDGILIAPVLYQETLPFFQECQNRSIPCVLFNTNIRESNALSFFGQNLYESGRVAADLVCLGQEPGEYGVLHFDEDLNDSVHLLEKEKGFRDYVKEKLGDVPVHSLNRTSSSDSLFREKLNSLLEIPNLRGLFVSSSKGTAVAASLLEAFGKREIRLVGYDLLEDNIKYLESGIIDFLINQRPQEQAQLGLSCLANHLVFKKKSPDINLFPLGIITKQNLSSYLVNLENTIEKREQTLAEAQ
jgi:LacI family transcriptional regulator